MLAKSLLPNCQFLFCQATQFCSAKLNIFARGGQGPPGPPPRNAYDSEDEYVDRHTGSSLISVK